MRPTRNLNFSSLDDAQWQHPPNYPKAFECLPPLLRWGFLVSIISSTWIILKHRRKCCLVEKKRKEAQWENKSRAKSERIMMEQGKISQMKIKINFHGAIFAFALKHEAGRWEAYESGVKMKFLSFLPSHECDSAPPHQKKNKHR